MAERVQGKDDQNTHNEGNETPTSKEVLEVACKL